jgi:hypothetical protein
MIDDQYEPAIDSAPGKELLDELRIGGGFDVLERFFWLRLEWCSGYPLVHDRFVTYGAFDDLHGALDQAQRYQLIPAMARLADSVPDRYFHSALFLLNDLIPSDAIGCRPEGFSDILLRLRLRTEKLSFLPNLECAWNSLAVKQRYLKTEGDPLASYSPAQLGIDSSRWTAFFPYPLLNYKSKPFRGCRSDLGHLRQQIQDMGCAPGERRLVYSTRIEESRYWVWRLPGRSGTAQLCRIVFLRQPASGPLGLGHWDLFRQFSERDTPKAISTRLLKIEFGAGEFATVVEAG